MRFILILCLVLVIIGYFVVTKVLPKNTSSHVVSDVSPTAPVTDFAPSVPMNQKTTVVVRQSDSSTITYIIPNAQVDTFLQKLPEGETLVSKMQNK